MYIVIWEYMIKPGYQTDFEEFYSSGGAWAQLFRKAAGFAGAELLRDSKESRRYITLDRWDTSQAYDAFMAQWQKEYRSPDAKCEALTETELRLGAWESVDPAMR